MFLKERPLSLYQRNITLDASIFKTTRFNNYSLSQWDKRRIVLSKSIPDYAPDFLSFDAADDLIVCNQLESLVWLANHGSLEYHVPFQRIGQVTPLEIVFDLDPPEREHFVLAVKAAKLLKQILDDLNLVSFVKTSGNKGLQIYIPIREGSMTYGETVFLLRLLQKH